LDGFSRIEQENAFTAKDAKDAEKNAKMHPEVFFMENVLTLVG
jgi:hypothetical protein